MYKVLIVDDEPYIRKGLMTFIKWHSLNCKVVYEAKDGYDAKNYIQNNAVDMVITDIKMPGMNGIDLSEYIYNHHSHIKIIMLTGYADFEYAQAGIRFGVIDFVLKPTSNEKIISAVKKCVKLLNEFNEKNKEIESLEDKIDKNVLEIREKILQDIINEVMLDEVILNNKAKQYSIEINYYYILVLHIGFMDINTNRNILSIKNLLSMVLKDHFHINTNISNRSFCTLINFKKENNNKNLQTLLSKCEEIIDTVNNFMDLPIRIGISRSHNKISDALQAFEEAKKSLSFKFYSDSTIFIYSDVEANVTNQYTKLLTNSDQIINSLTMGDEDRAIEYLNKLRIMVQANQVSVDQVKSHGVLLCSLIVQHFSNYCITLEEIIPNHTNLYEQILDTTSIIEFFDLLTLTIKKISKHIHNNVEEGNLIVRQAKNFIQNNYTQNIKLHHVANAVHVNSSYLSRVFKKEENVTLTEYIIKLRIEKAKELLSQTDCKAYEIASQIGFIDPSYFSSTFKRYVGVTPSDYKISHHV